jgi:GNAT superfamily N-acetyltransferase
MDTKPTHVRLKDGTPITIRTISLDDISSLLAMHERLSDQTLQMRYMSMARSPLVNQVEHLCRSDPKYHLALVAVSCLLQPVQIVAAAEYAIPDRTEPCVAEIGIVVEDSYQHRGLGSALLTQLVLSARAHGICELTADIAYDNHAILEFVRKTTLPHRAIVREGLLHLSIELTEDLARLEQALRLPNSSESR